MNTQFHEIQIARPYGQDRATVEARAKELGGWFRSYGNYRAERQYIDTYVMPVSVSKEMLLSQPETAPESVAPPTEQGIEYTVDLGGGKKRVQHTRRFVW